MTPPLRTLLASSDLIRHRALVAVELEVLAKKFDRFGWERDRGSAARDRIMIDWIEALCDFPIEEIRAACRRAVQENPDRMPNEGHILRAIVAARSEVRRATPKREDQRPSHLDRPVEERRAEAARIMASFAAAKRMDGGAA